MKKITSTLLIAVLSLTVISRVISAEDVANPEVALQGTIRDKKGHPLPGAIVIVATETTSKGVETASDGKYVFKLPSGGKYKIRVIAEMHGLMEGEYDLAASSFNTINFELDDLVCGVNAICCPIGTGMHVDTTSSNTYTHIRF